jgi:hypothetical protein
MKRSLENRLFFGKFFFSSFFYCVYLDKLLVFSHWSLWSYMFKIADLREKQGLYTLCLHYETYLGVM